MIPARAAADKPPRRTAQRPQPKVNAPKRKPKKLKRRLSRWSDMFEDAFELIEDIFD